MRASSPAAPSRVPVPSFPPQSPPPSPSPPMLLTPFILTLLAFANPFEPTKAGQPALPTHAQATGPSPSVLRSPKRRNQGNVSAPDQLPAAAYLIPVDAHTSLDIDKRSQYLLDKVRQFQRRTPDTAITRAELDSAIRDLVHKRIIESVRGIKIERDGHREA